MSVISLCSGRDDCTSNITNKKDPHLSNEMYHFVEMEVLYFTILYCVMCCIVLHCTVMHCIV